LVEFALVLPVFLVLVFAIIDFGLGLYANVAVANAAREGARLGAVGATEAQIQQRVYDTAGWAGNSITAINVSYIDEDGDGNIMSGDSVQVEVQCSYTFITPLVPMISLMSGGLIASSLPCDSTAVMRLE